VLYHIYEEELKEKKNRKATVGPVATKKRSEKREPIVCLHVIVPRD